MRSNDRKIELYITVGDISDAFASLIRGQSRVAIDTETSGLDWRTADIGTVQLYLPDSNLALLIKASRFTFPRNLIALIEDGNVEKIFHHALFDLRFISSTWGVTPRNIACTKVAAKLLWPDESSETYSLKALASSMAGIALDKSMQASDWLDSELTEEQIEYAIQDVIYLPLILDNLRERASGAMLAEPLAKSFQYIPVRLLTDLRSCGDIFGY